MNKKLPSTKTLALLSGISFGTMIILSVVGTILEPMVKPGSPLYQNISILMKGIFFTLFLVLAFSLSPLMIRAFFALLPLVFGNLPNKPAFLQSLIQNREKIGSIATLIIWGTYLLGLLISSPFILQLLNE